MVVPLISFALVEFINGNINIFMFHPIRFFMNAMIYYGVYAVLLFIVNRFDFAMITGLLFFSSYALINKFVLEFKGSPILPFDIYSIDTALNVVSEYHFVFDSTKWIVIVMSVSSILLIVYLYHGTSILKKKRLFIKGRITSFILVVVLLSSSYYLFYKTSILKDNGMSISTWSQSTGFYENGTALSFVDNMTYLKPKRPDDYYAGAIKNILDVPRDKVIYENKNSEEVKNIIVVMNESFADFNVINEFNASKELFPYSSQLENTISGYTYASVFGGGTANSEFEFLTGNTLAYLPPGSVAYQMYVKNNTYSLIDTLKQNGFYSSFIHTYYESGWNRKKVYDLLGMDETLFFDDMEMVAEDYFRVYPSDRYAYEHVIQQYENSTSDKNFIFCVTMQNHGAYDFPLDNPIDIYDTDQEYPLASQYLTTLEESDRALQTLVDYFSEVDEPTVILQFGDHQPGVEEEFYEWLYGKQLTELSVAETQKRYMTPYLMWANYPLEEKKIDMSINYLSTLLLQVTGIEMSDFNWLLNNLYFKFPIINAIGAINEYGMNYALDELVENEDLNNYTKVQYQHLFDTRNSKKEMFVGHVNENRDLEEENLE